MHFFLWKNMLEMFKTLEKQGCCFMNEPKYATFMQWIFILVRFCFCFMSNEKASNEADRVQNS